MITTGFVGWNAAALQYTRLQHLVTVPYGRARFRLFAVSLSARKRSARVANRCSALGCSHQHALRSGPSQSHRKTAEQFLQCWLPAARSFISVASLSCRSNENKMHVTRGGWCVGGGRRCLPAANGTKKQRARTPFALSYSFLRSRRLGLQLELLQLRCAASRASALNSFN